MPVRTKNPLLLTADGRAMIEARIHDIRERRMSELRPLLVEHERDERHVAEFESLLEEALEWEALLAEADTLPAESDRDEVALGARVCIVYPDDSLAWVRVVHPREAFLDDERISATSPLGTALMGAKVGDLVFVEAPVGTWECFVRAIQ